MSTSIDSNTWYNVCYGDPPSSVCLVAARISSTSLGAIAAINTTTPDEPNYSWQMLPISPSPSPASSTYLLRSRLLGPTYCMHMWWDNVTGLSLAGFVENTSPGQAANISQWVVSPTSEDAETNYLSTVANGTNWHLDRTSGGVVFLQSSSDIGSTDPQVFGFSSVAAIDDKIWSYTATSTSTVPTTLSTSTTTATTAASTTPATNNSPGDSTPPNHNHTSTGAIAGGIVGGIAVLLLLISAILLYLHRRKQGRNAAYLRQQTPALPSMPELGPAQPHETGPWRPHEIDGRPLFLEKP